MPQATLDQIAAIAIDPVFKETGGAHNTQGIEFQRHWAVLRMFELTEQGGRDFLFLFEALQDVAILDSGSTPTAICICQVKKRSRSEWTWALLTGVHEPNAKKKKALDDVKKSPLGKLYAVVRAITTFRSSGSFVSNFGCDLPLFPDGSFATTTSESLDRLPLAHGDLLREALACFHDEGETVPDLSRLNIERVNISPEDPSSVLVGKVHDFLLARSAEHAGQARALVDALLLKVGALSLRSATCRDFDELRKSCGFSKTEFDSALGDLQDIPDDSEGFKSCVAALERDGLSVFDSNHIKVAGGRVFRRRVMGGTTNEELRLAAACESWVLQNPPPNTNILRYVESGAGMLADPSTSISHHDVMAQILIASMNYARSRPQNISTQPTI